MQSGMPVMGGPQDARPGSSRARARGVWFARERRDLVSDRGSPVNSQEVLIGALENELVSIRSEKAKLSVRESVILKTLSTYSTGGTPAQIRATREMNTVDMARTVIRNAPACEVERAV